MDTPVIPQIAMRMLLDESVPRLHEPPTEHGGLRFANPPYVF
ncbi:hypothetical protein SAMN05428959_106107 [Duganella sp. CF517]|nr:hypothetical protein SAMN05428959_106107 [Duganella sp. CF517]